MNMEKITVQESYSLYSFIISIQEGGNKEIAGGAVFFNKAMFFL